MHECTGLAARVLEHTSVARAGKCTGTDSHNAQRSMAHRMPQCTALNGSTKCMHACMYVCMQGRMYRQDLLLHDWLQCGWTGQHLSDLHPLLLPIQQLVSNATGTPDQPAPTSLTLACCFVPTHLHSCLQVSCPRCRNTPLCHLLPQHPQQPLLRVQRSPHVT